MHLHKARRMKGLSISGNVHSHRLIRSKMFLLIAARNKCDQRIRWIEEKHTNKYHMP